METDVSSLNPKRVLSRLVRQQHTVSWLNGHKKGACHEKAGELLLPEEDGKPSLLLLGGGGHDSADPGDPVPPALPIGDAWEAGQWRIIPVVRCVIGVS